MIGVQALDVTTHNDQFQDQNPRSDMTHSLINSSFNFKIRYMK